MTERKRRGIGHDTLQAWEENRQEAEHKGFAHHKIVHLLVGLARTYPPGWVTLPLFTEKPFGRNPVYEITQYIENNLLDYHRLWRPIAFAALKSLEQRQYGDCLFSNRKLPPMGVEYADGLGMLKVEGANLDLLGIKAKEPADIEWLRSRIYKPRLTFDEQLLLLHKHYGSDYREWPELVITEVKLTEHRLIDKTTDKAAIQVREYMIMLAMHFYEIAQRQSIDRKKRRVPTRINCSCFCDFICIQGGLLEKITGQILLVTPENAGVSRVILEPNDVPCLVAGFVRKSRT